MRGTPGGHSGLICSLVFRCADIDINLDGNVFSRQPSVAEADPFLAFSTEDLAGMDKEVEDILSGDSDSDSDSEVGLEGDDVKEGSSSEDSLTGVSRGHKRKLGELEDTWTELANTSVLSVGTLGTFQFDISGPQTRTAE